MTLDETKQILTILKANYPQSFKNQSNDQALAFLKLWSRAFRDVPAKLVVKAIEDIIFNDPREFSPNIGQVSCKIKDMITVDVSEQAVQVWDNLMTLLSKVGREGITEENIEKISPTLLICYSVGDIKQLAITDYVGLSYERTRFMSNYKVAENNRVTEAMRTGKLLEVANEQKLNALGISKQLLLEEKENGTN